MSFHTIHTASSILIVCKLILCSIAVCGKSAITFRRKFFCDVSDMNQTFQAITNILQDIFVNEESIRRVLNMAVNSSTVLVGFRDWLSSFLIRLFC